MCTVDASASSRRAAPGPFGVCAIMTGTDDRPAPALRLPSRRPSAQEMADSAAQVRRFSDALGGVAPPVLGRALSARAMGAPEASDFGASRMARTALNRVVSGAEVGHR